MKRILITLAGILSFIYLMNPTWGVFEILPDNLPLIGNIDEATATMVLLAALRYFGWDLTKLFGNKTIDFGSQ
ncbi:MAG: hypothetical protein WAR83_05395 [Flavobacteriales bacterium]|nr:DUF1232 domain-containing protein [Flavobacteriales bacterium]